MNELTFLLLEKGMEYAEPKVKDFLYKNKKKNAAEDQANGMYDISHVAVLGGEHD